MKNMLALVVGMACLAPLTAPAQWQWIDGNGRKVFSDRAPPADTPEKNILKQPGGRPLAAAPASPPVTASAVAQPGSKDVPKLSGKDKELEAKKKQAEAAEADKKKNEEVKLTATRAENCARAQQSKAAMDSGQRIARMNEKGEREFMDDAARSAETQRLQGIIETDCR